MFRNFSLQTRTASRLRRQWPAVILLVVLAVCIGRVAPTAQAATRQDVITNARFYLRVISPPLLCAGQDHSILVTPLVELNGYLANGEKFNLKGQIVGGVRVMAEIQDTSIATVSPASQKSGYLTRNLLETSSIQLHPGEGAVTFKLHAKKAGITNMYLTAEVPAQFSDGTKKYFGPNALPVGGPFMVVDCQYRVTMTYNGRPPSGSSTGFLPGTLIKLDEQALNLKGQGQFTFTESPYLPACTYIIRSLDSTTGITGYLDAESSPVKLHLQFAYAPGTRTTIGKCTATLLGSGNSITTETEDPNWFLDFKEADFAEPWGTRKFPTLNGGSMSITVVPVAPSATK